MTNKKRFWHFLFPISYFLFPISCLHSADNIDHEKLTLETNIEEKITNALSKFLSSQNFVVIVNIEPIIELTPSARPPRKLQIEQLAPPPEEEKITKDYMLPGVPTRRSMIGEERMSQSPVQVIIPPPENEVEVLKRFIKKITVTVKIDKSVPDGTVDKVKEIITKLLFFNTVRGDKLIIEKMEFYKTKIPWWGKELTVSSMFSSIIWLLGLILFAFFLFGPLNNFFKHIMITLSSKSTFQSPSQQSADGFFSRGQVASATKGDESSSVKVALGKEKSTKSALFTFINEGNLRNLLYLLKDETPDKVALVLSYMQDDWASFVLSQLTPVLQSKVVVELANVKLLNPKDVAVMQAELERKIDYLIGGAAQIIKLCEHSDKRTCNNILAALAINNLELASIAEKVKAELLTIDDLYFVDTIGLRVIFREIPLSSLAVGLMASADTTKEKILKTLPIGASEILKQEMEFDTTVAQARIDEEERKIVMLMRKLRNEGRIAIFRREITKEMNTGKDKETDKSKDGSLESFRKEGESKPIPSPSSIDLLDIVGGGKRKPIQIEPEEIKQQGKRVQLESRQERLAKIKERLKGQRRDVRGERLEERG